MTTEMLSSRTAGVCQLEFDGMGADDIGGGYSKIVFVIRGKASPIGDASEYLERVTPGVSSPAEGATSRSAHETTARA